MEEALQHETTTQRIGLPPTGPGNHRPDGPKARHALTFNLDHSGGADHIGFLIVHLEKVLTTLDGEAVEKMVCDFSFTQILAYAEISGSVNEKRAFREIHQMLTARIGEPWLTVHLTCPVETQIERIKRRARIGETVPGSAFLKRLNGQIENELSHLNGNVIAIQLERESSVDEISRKIQKEIAKSQDFAPPS